MKRSQKQKDKITRRKSRKSRNSRKTSSKRINRVRRLSKEKNVRRSKNRNSKRKSNRNSRRVNRNNKKTRRRRRKSKKLIKGGAIANIGIVAGEQLYLGLLEKGFITEANKDEAVEVIGMFGNNAKIGAAGASVGKNYRNDPNLGVPGMSSGVSGVSAAPTSASSLAANPATAPSATATQDTKKSTTGSSLTADMESGLYEIIAAESVISGGAPSMPFSKSKEKVYKTLPVYIVESKEGEIDAYFVDNIGFEAPMPVKTVELTSTRHFPRFWQKRYRGEVGDSDVKYSIRRGIWTIDQLKDYCDSSDIIFHKKSPVGLDTAKSGSNLDTWWRLLYVVAVTMENNEGYMRFVYPSTDSSTLTKNIMDITCDGIIRCSKDAIFRLMTAKGGIASSAHEDLKTYVSGKRGNFGLAELYDDLDSYDPKAESKRNYLVITAAAGKSPFSFAHGAIRRNAAGVVDPSGIPEHRSKWFVAQ